MYEKAVFDKDLNVWCEQFTDEYVQKSLICVEKRATVASWHCAAAQMIASSLRDVFMRVIYQTIQCEREQREKAAITKGTEIAANVAFLNKPLIQRKLTVGSESRHGKGRDDKQLRKYTARKQRGRVITWPGIGGADKQAQAHGFC